MVGDTGTATEPDTCGGTGYCVSSAANVIIDDDHEGTHELAILAKDIALCEDVTYDMQGEADQ